MLGISSVSITAFVQQLLRRVGYQNPASRNPGGQLSAYKDSRILFLPGFVRVINPHLLALGTVCW